MLLRLPPRTTCCCTLHTSVYYRSYKQRVVLPFWLYTNKIDFFFLFGFLRAHPNSWSRLVFQSRKWNKKEKKKQYTHRELKSTRTALWSFYSLAAVFFCHTRRPDVIAISKHHTVSLARHSNVFFTFHSRISLIIEKETRRVDGLLLNSQFRDTSIKTFHITTKNGRHHGNKSFQSNKYYNKKKTVTLQIDETLWVARFPPNPSTKRGTMTCCCCLRRSVFRSRRSTCVYFKEVSRWTVWNEIEKESLITNKTEHKGGTLENLMFYVQTHPDGNRCRLFLYFFFWSPCSGKCQEYANLLTSLQ